MASGEAPDSRIELDLDSGAPPVEPRRARPSVDPGFHERPKLEPVLKAGDVGTDESRQTVGYLVLVSLVPSLLGVLLGHGSMGLMGIAIPVGLAWGLITGHDWICEYAFWSCVLQLVLAPISVLGLPHAALIMPSLVLRYGALAVLLSGRPLSRTAYFGALGAIGLGTLMGILGALLR
jgi:hypothetical protein